MRLTLSAQQKLHYLKTGDSLDSDLEVRIRELESTHGRHPYREVFDFGFTEQDLKNALREYVQQLKDVKEFTYELQERCDQSREQGTDLMTELDRLTTEEMSEDHERLEKDLVTLWIVWLKHKKQARDNTLKQKWSLPFGDLVNIEDEDKDEIAAKVERIVA